jgi:hypothetical protein
VEASEIYYTETLPTYSAYMQVDCKEKDFVRGICENQIRIFRNSLQSAVMSAMKEFDIVPKFS